MKKTLIGIFASIFTILSCSNDKQHAIRSLDNAIEHREIYDAIHEVKSQEMRDIFNSAESDSAKWVAARALENHFYIRDVDSCAFYIQHMLRLCGQNESQRIISNAIYAQNLYRADSLDKSFRIIESIDFSRVMEMDSVTRYAYCRSAYQIYRDLSHTDKYKRTVALWWQTDSTDAGAIFNHDRELRKSKQYEKAINNLSKSTRKTQRDSAVFYYYLARLYDYAGDESKSIMYYAKSAEYDMYVSCQTYESLFMLSRKLFETGDFKKAEQYMHIALTDAKLSNWSTRYKTILQAEYILMEALLSQEKQKRTVILTAMSISVVLLLVTIMMLLHIVRQSNRIAKSEKKLQELSKIKDGFLAHYMEACVDYLNKVDEYRSSLRNTVKTEGIDSIRALLRKPSFASDEFDSLLSNFDSTFLRIFPDFVKKVNENMQEGYELIQPAAGKLSTELRILALIKIGISSRQRIAKVLNMSVTTIYSYHSNLQKHSLHPNSNFDAVILGL